MTVEAIKAALGSRRFLSYAEDDLQAALELVFTEAGLEYRREVPLGKASRVDFMVGDVAVEVKTKGSASSVLRQLHRYAMCLDVEAIVLVTTRYNHARLPAILEGKPLAVVMVSRAFR